MDLIFLKTAFITMFVALDPPGLIAIFLSLTAHMNEHDRKATAYHAVMVALAILVAAAFGGQATLGLLGITVPAFRIAGGLLLFYIAFEMVFEKRAERKEQKTEEIVEHDHPKNIAVFPLAIPMMAGPGAITATILQADRAVGIVNEIGLVMILAAIIGICLVCFLLATRLDRLLGNTGRIVLSRLLGLLLAALAIQIVGDGVMAFAR